MSDDKSYIHTKYTILVGRTIEAQCAYMNDMDTIKLRLV